ncbi:MAG: hypothetical protein U0905_20285 [Pirellulales bacterium]
MPKTQIIQRVLLLLASTLLFAQSIALGLLAQACLGLVISFFVLKRAHNAFSECHRGKIGIFGFTFPIALFGILLLLMWGANACLFVFGLSTLNPETALVRHGLVAIYGGYCLGNILEFFAPSLMQVFPNRIEDRW